MSVAVSWLVTILGIAAGLVFLYCLLLAWVLWQYGGAIYRIFETKPLFLAHSVKPQLDGEDVVLQPTADRQLQGTYFRHTSGTRRGVLLFTHEFTANRWLFEPYIGYLREDGFDIFTFDFCGHGSSDPIPGYEPLQWVTSHEGLDVQTALDYLRSRPDADKNGVGVFGVSKGGGAAIAAAANDKSVRAMVTDGAFPTHAMVTDYTMRWCVIYVRLKSAYKVLPRFFWDVCTTCAIMVLERKHKVQYIRLERRLRKFAGRPLLMINGERDPYIKPSIARRFYDCARKPKELWLVKKAKHNGCLDADPETYREKVRSFFLAHFPMTQPLADQPVKVASLETQSPAKAEKLLASGT